MIVRPRPGILKLFFVLRGSIVPRIAPQLCFFAVYATAVVLVARFTGFDFAGYSLAPFTLLGVTLSIYLGFRNNAAYERWWESRKLWGQLAYEVRNLSRASLALVPEHSAQVRPMLMEALAFCHFLRGELRNVNVIEEARAFIGNDVDTLAALQNKPDELLRRMGRRLGALKAAGHIDAIGFRILDEHLSNMAALQAGCERISTTPLPFAYTLLLHRSAYVFCLLLPFGLVASTGWGTPLFTVVVAYSYFGLDALSEELEDPFGTEDNDLPLDSLCRTCEISVREALGEPSPAMPAPKRYYFS